MPLGRLLWAAHSADPTGWWCVGEVDFTTRDEWSAVLGELPRASDVHLDLSQVRFIDAHGTSLLVAAAQDAGADRRFVLHHPPAAMLRVLQQFWPSVPTIEVAR
ncbi:STAS domain-containing protein [Nocardia sp. NPDC052001]|uniref:STAS domain-containing protein n=1 Tax=Nocardia sp. NPDC052001 TaxID=3154853 RepID=UPI00342F63FC